MALRKTIFGRTRKTFSLKELSGYLDSTGQSRYGGAMHPNGFAYSAPNAGVNLIQIEAATDIITSLGAYGNTGTSPSWGGGVLAPNGMCYYPSSNSNKKPAKYNPTTNTFTQIGSLFGNTYGCYSSILCSNGMIYCIPERAPQIMKINPSTDATSFVGTNFGATSTSKWQGSAEANNGNIYMTPFAATQVMEFNPTTEVCTLVGTTYSTTNAFSSIIRHPNGKLYFVPFNEPSLLEFNPNTYATTIIATFSGTSKFQGGFLGINGKLYLVPHSYAHFVEIDVTTNKVTEIASVYGSAAQKYMGSIPTGGKNTYITAYSGGAYPIIKLTVKGDIFGGSSQIPSTLATLPTSDFNKYFNKAL